MTPEHSVASAAACPPLAPSLPSPGTSGHTTGRPEKRRTKPCHHFARTKGWCPIGDACNFIHDPALSKAPDLIRTERDSFFRSSKEPRANNNITIGMTQAHCWAYIQGMCVNPACQLFHPEDIIPYIAYTPCLRWPNCADGAYFTLRHHVPIPVPMTVPAPLVLPPTGGTMPEMVAVIPNYLRPVPVQGSLPYGSYEINGTTYFTPPVQVAPLPPNPMFYDHAIIAPNGYGSASHASSQFGVLFEASNYVYDQGTPPTVDWQGPNGFDSQVFESELPEEQLSIPMEDANKPASRDVEDPATRLRSTGDEEFPYRPPKNQRVGHARRISVQMKKVDTISLTAAA